MTSRAAEAGRRLLEESVTGAVARGGTAIPEPEAKAILASWGIAVPRGGVGRSLAEVERLAAALSPPLALKVVSPDLLHKTSVGGVALNVGRGEIAQAHVELLDRVAQAVPGAQITGVLVEEMVRHDLEAVASVRRDPQLGLVLMVGLGGLWVEVFQDVTFRLLPVGRLDVVEMLDELRAASLLGRVAGLRCALAEALLAIAALGLDLPTEVAEVEINPLALTPAGACALDAVMLLTVG